MSPRRGEERRWISTPPLRLASRRGVEEGWRRRASPWRREGGGGRVFLFLRRGPSLDRRRRRGRKKGEPDQQQSRRKKSFPFLPVVLVIYREVPLPLLECWLVVDFGTRRGCFCMLLPSTSYASHFFFEISQLPRMDGWIARPTCSKERSAASLMMANPFLKLCIILYFAQRN